MTTSTSNENTGFRKIEDPYQQDRDALKAAVENFEFDYLNDKAGRARVACAVLNGTLHEDPSFAAASSIMNCGPANDFNGLRSAAERARKEWETRVMHPALNIAAKLKARRVKEASAL